MSDKLKQCRTQIDRIDDELLKLFNQRAALAQQIGHLKNNDMVLRPEREAQILRRMQATTQARFPMRQWRSFTPKSCRNAARWRRRSSVAYLGPEGTFTEAAALKSFWQCDARPAMRDHRRCIPCGGKRYGALWCRSCGKLYRRSHRPDTGFVVAKPATSVRRSDAGDPSMSAWASR